ncbi:MAG: aminoacetone oxidase family FAD-binding enzyme [Sulfurospirillaceae bacterium]|nr:aminoacetone oxidase family FAD-binding enzyme [Sulfurospirillaceae bacterium]MDD2825744.1 aminoacetone oxidase family FAD-binding enzyme [Sulfurospirillaceae bacterium]
MKIHDIVFIGAGASALMAASFIKGKDVALIDSNTKIGAKILISGGGKCNLTNRFACANNYLADASFMKYSFERWSPEDTISFASKHQIALEERGSGQLFCAHSAKDLVSVFSHLTRQHTFYFSTKVLHVTFAEHFIIQTDHGAIGAQKVVVASGGLSYTSIGASGIGYEIAKDFGHEIITPQPALVGFTLQKEQFWMKELSGIAIPVSIEIEGKTIQGNLLFAHKGISGPAVLTASLYWKKGKIRIDFLPNVSLPVLFKQNSKKQISSVLPLPKRFIKGFLDSLRVEDKVISKLTLEDKKNLETLKAYDCSPAGNFGFTKAEVTKGGVSTAQINPKTFESLLCPNLYFLGEVLDVTGELGGFNFQWAFASGYSMVQHL